MPDRLFIRPGDAEGRHWRWRRVDADGTATSGSGPLSGAGPADAGVRVVLLVPGEHLLLTTARIPLRSRTRAAGAVPWALEDRLAGDVEALHFALGAADAAGDWPVAVIAHETLAGFLQACTEAGLAPHAAVPEPLALPAPADGHWQALEEAGRVVCRTGPASGFACEAALLPAVAGALDAPEAVTVTRIEGQAADWPAALAGRLNVEATTDDPLAVLAASAGSPPIDLLQGPYSRRERMGRLWRRWRVPAALAATLVALLVVHWALGYRALGQRQEALQDAAEEVLRAAAPDIGRIVNPRVQLKNRLDAVRGSGEADDNGLLALLERAGPVLAGQEGITLTLIDWRNETLDLSVEAAELPQMDRLQRALEEAGLAVELRGVKRDDERVRGEVRVTEASA